MATTTYSRQEGIDAEPTPATVEPRTRRAVTGCMVVVPEGDASGRFDVYSANDGENNTYTVDLRAETCECGDYEHRRAHCKHQRRCKLALGIMDVPESLRDDIDEVLANSREKYGADRHRTRDTEPTAHTPASAAEDTAPEALAADGGQLLVENEDDEDDEEAEAETEPETERETESVDELIGRVDREAGRLPVDQRVALHGVVVESYHWPLCELPDYDVYSAAIDCATDTARALARTELELEGDR